MKLSLSIMASLVILTSCETDFVDPNSPTEETALSSREGLFAVAVGLRQTFAVTGLRYVIESPALTTREASYVVTLEQYRELEEGAQNLVNANAHIQRLWGSMLQVIYRSEEILAATEEVDLEDGTTSGLRAMALFFKAMSIGSLAQNFEQVVVETSLDNNAEFIPRLQAYELAIADLEAAKTTLAQTPLSDEFLSSGVIGSIDLENSINAYLARYNLFVGNYAEAISAANLVDVSVQSLFTYDGQNPNPIRGNGSVINIQPRDNPLVDRFDGDGRTDFYFTQTADISAQGLPIDSYNLNSFFGMPESSIPVYLPGEMDLIIAEASVRSGDSNPAVDAINRVRTKTNDIYGLNAGLAEYSGAVTEDALLEEIYRNRRAELFMSGMSLEDSRRFGRTQPSGAPSQFDEERNRNFYPYPVQERLNNSNTPPDPAI